MMILQQNRNRPAHFYHKGIFLYLERRLKSIDEPHPVLPNQRG